MWLWWNYLKNNQNSWKTLKNFMKILNNVQVTWRKLKVVIPQSASQPSKWILFFFTLLCLLILISFLCFKCKEILLWRIFFALFFLTFSLPGGYKETNKVLKEKKNNRWGKKFIRSRVERIFHRFMKRTTKDAHISMLLATITRPWWILN